MSQTKEILRQLNPGFFEERQVSEPHACIVSAKKTEKNAKGEITKQSFLQTSDRVIPGISGKSLYLRAQFMKAGNTEEVIVGGQKRVAFRPSKKATPGNIFKNQQPNLFNMMVEELKAGRYKPAGKDNDKNDMVETDALVYGKKIAVNVPTYVPQQTNEEGKRTALLATRYDAVKDEYVPNQKVTMGVFRFFADDDDLNELLDVTAKLVDKQVMPYVTEKVTVITEKAGEQTVKTKEEPLTPEEELAQAEKSEEEEEEEVEV